MSLDSLSLELEAEMLRQVGQSIQRVKKRLVDTDLTFQLRPPETEELELSKWEDKVRKLIDHRDVMAFPKLLDFKRQFKHKHSDDQEVRQVLGRKSRDVLDSKQRHYQVRDKETTKVYKSSFGGAVVGESLRTIENYSGQNTFYGGVNSSSRVLIRKDGRFTNYDRASDLPPWICEGAYANNDPALFRERPCGVYTLPFQSQGRHVAQTGDKLRGELIARRENLDSWKSRDHGPHFARTPESQSVRWLQSQQEFFDSSDQQSIRAESLARGISRETPKIVLGDITRQTFVVTKQKEMKKKKEKTIDKEDGAGSSTSRQMSPNSRELRLDFQIKHRFSYVHQSQDISAKLERAENSDLAMMHRFCSKVSTGHGRKDYTAGSLNLPILDAPFISTGASAGHGPLLDSPPLSVILVHALGTQIEDVSTPKKPFACRSTDVIEPLQVPADDPVGLSSIPLSSPVDGTIRRHLRHDPRPKTSYRGALRTLSLPDVSLRGILLDEGDVQYLPPLVTTVEAESIMAAFSKHNSLEQQ